MNYKVVKHFNWFLITGEHVYREETNSLSSIREITVFYYYECARTCVRAVIFAIAGIFTKRL